MTTAAAPGAGAGSRPPSPPLELEGVAHRFGRHWVLRGIDLRLAPGEVVAVVGANGAGKSTLLRIAATLLRPLRGGGRLFGLDLLEHAGAARARVGYVGDSPGLYEDLTPPENLAFAAAMRGEPRLAREIPGVLERVGLSGAAHRRVRRFSQGMRRRVALGRILLSAPDLLLLDEPYASLDPGGVTLVNDTIREVTARGGAALIATHDLRSGDAIVRRVLALDRGLLREDAP